MLKSELTNMKPLHQQGLFLCLISLAYCWISLPGLYGGFILDDWPNLEQIGHNSLLHFVLNGISSQLGRPVSLLTFALQAEHWPHNPFPFKVVGLVIHIINAWLVYLCCHLIAQLKNWPERSSLIFAGSVFGLWLFLPLNISTTFYVVQRMVLLAAFFSLIGIAGFLWGFRLSTKESLNKSFDKLRTNGIVLIPFVVSLSNAPLSEVEGHERNQLHGQSKKGLIIATLGITVTYVLGILSKENAVLTGLGISVLYWLLLRPQHGSSLWDKWIIIFGVMPSLIILTYLCFHLDQHTRGDFTPYQRLLTESVIVLDYLDKILLPTPFKLNIFNDGFPVYKALFSSSIVIKAVLFWLFLIVLAICIRKRLPFFSFAVFWFLSDHLLESSIFGLELYFEHRNYLPSLGIIIGIIGTVIEIVHKVQSYPPKLQKAVNFANIALISVMSLVYVMVYGAEVSSWKNPSTLAISALTERPNSMRAHQEAAAFFANLGQIESSTKILDKIEQRWPSTGAYAQYLMLKCHEDTLNIPDKTTLTHRFKNGAFDRGTLEAMKDVLTFKKKGGCNFLVWEDYLEYLELLFNNPAFGSQKDDFLILQAYAYTALKQPEKAALALDRFPNDVATTDYLLYKTQFFAIAGDTKKSLEIIGYIKSRYGNNLKYKLTNEKMVDSMETMLRKHMAKSGKK